MFRHPLFTFSGSGTLVGREIRSEVDRRLLDTFRINGAACLALTDGGRSLLGAHLEGYELQSTVVDLLHGLNHVHRCGIVHLDVKPANVLQDVLGVCRLADFGNADFQQQRFQPAPQRTGYLKEVARPPRVRVSAVGPSTIVILLDGIVPM